MTEGTEIEPSTIQAVRRFIEKVFFRYDCIDAILFGSRARRTHRPDSDADIAVLLRGRPGKFAEVKLEMADIAYDVLLLETGIRIQPLPIWEEEWTHPENFDNPDLIDNIHREGISVCHWGSVAKREYR
ncbi:MAG: nucleotidyltransferase domain-containing protein [Methylohalobius sp. ZOD2]